MEINELITKINKSVDEFDLVTTRKYIEDNIEIVNENRARLKGNAREILLFLIDNLDSEEKSLTRNEMATIHAINSYATKFDIRGLKLTIKGKEQLLLRKETLKYLNTDAKTVLEGIGAINKNGQQ